MNRQILKPQADVPLIVKLDKGPEGKETSSRGELQYMYTLNDDSSVMWLPPEARTALLRTGAQPGDLIEIVKSLRGRTAIWNVQVVPDAQEPPARGMRMLAPRPAPETQPQYSNGRNVQHSNGGSNQPQAQPAKNVSPVSQQLADCLRAAIDASMEAQEYAHSLGGELHFNEEDIRAMGLSIYIGRQREGRS